MIERTDFLIAGGGLAGGLIALAMAARRPQVAVTLVEAGPAIGGNHIWSFFDSDVAPDERTLLAPLVAHRWEGYDVAFPAFQRSLTGCYNSISSERLDAAVRAALPAERIFVGTPIGALDASGATLGDGRHIAATGVIDARGAGAMSGLDLGWQKFAGRLLRLARPHGLTRPIIMDARVAQIDGYRFVYVLPFGPDSLFVEDTYYADGPALDIAVLDDRIRAYAAGQGWEVAEVGRCEAGALPIVLAGRLEWLWPEDDVPRAGMAAGLFHPMTGYSLPDAVRTAALVAALPDLSSPALERALRAHAKACWRQRGYYRLLARLLFRAGSPELRYRVLERFYRLDEGLIMRLYAARSTALDKLRILAGKPPVPLGAAMRVLLAGGR